jgi:hypothetical protein
MKYPLHDLDDREFELLVVSICEEILGIGTINFSEGKDGGRDAKFTGKANKYPSESKPWEGKFIIQAKHTEKSYASCSDSDFQTILRNEVKKLTSLKKDKYVDYYLLFTNRRLSGLQDPKIEKFIDKDAGVENAIIGDERIQKWLNDNHKIAKSRELDKLLLPIQFYEEDLREIIIAFTEADIQVNKIGIIKDEISRINIEDKNELNSLSKEYFEDVFKKSYSEFDKIKVFLEDPINRLYKKYYDNTVADLQEKIVIRRDDYVTFDEIFSYIYNYILQNNIEKLKDSRRLIRVFLHYMYYNCDIGKEK